MESFKKEDPCQPESMFMHDVFMLPYHYDVGFGHWPEIDFASPFLGIDVHQSRLASVSESNSNASLPQMTDMPPWTPSMQSVSSSSSLELTSSPRSSPKSGNFECPFPGCQRTFTRKDNIKYHLKTHNENRDRPHACTMCHKAYYRAIDLSRHVSVTHYHVKAFQCQYCSQAYTRKEALKRHCEKSH